MLLVVLALALSLAVTGCGGGGSGGQGAKSAGEDRDGDGVAGERGEGGSESEEEEAPPAAASRCADGTCFECGSGICPKGFYCDEGASGGAACSWLPECAAAATCGCVKSGLGAGCSCEEKSSGVYVKCN